MKQLITASGAVVLILALIVELISVQLYCIKIINADYIMSLHNDMIRQFGCVTEECENKIKNDLAANFKCSTKDISVIQTGAPAEESGYITYEVKSKAGSLFNDKFWGIQQSDMEYVRNYVLVSQKEDIEESQSDN